MAGLVFIARITDRAMRARKSRSTGTMLRRFRMNFS
jgi:hypothetical protein